MAEYVYRQPGPMALPFPPSLPDFKHQHEGGKKKRQRVGRGSGGDRIKAAAVAETRGTRLLERPTPTRARKQRKPGHFSLPASRSQACTARRGNHNPPRARLRAVNLQRGAARRRKLPSPSLSHTRASCISRRHVVVVVAVQLPALLLLPVRRPPPRPPRRRVLLQQPPDERQHPLLPRGPLRRAQDGPEQQAAVAADGGAEGADVLLGVRAGGEARGEPAARGGLGGGGRGDGEGDGDGVRGPPPGAQGGPPRRQEGGVLAQPGPPPALHLRQGLLPRRGVVPPHLQLLPPRLQRRQARPAPRAAPRRRPRQQHVQRRRCQRLLHHVDSRQASIDRAARRACCVISQCVCVLSSHRLS